MLNREDRFFAPWGDRTPGGPSTYHVIDWDQRRGVSVTMDEELESDAPAIAHLSEFIDQLDPEIHMIHVSSQGDLISTSSDPKDDGFRCVYHPPLDTIKNSRDLQTISRSALEEVARLGPKADLVVYPQSHVPAKKFIFKYYFLLPQFRFIWREMNIYIRLPKHPNIVPFDRLVVDELEGGFVGFTTTYIPGGTLEENKSRRFKLKWLQQLMDVIDELNLNIGLSHQDVAPRNLVVDELTDSLMLFDFDVSACIGRQEYSEDRNDIKGVIFTMYEIITLDESLRAVRHEDQDVSAIEQKDWEQHRDVLLDHPVNDFRKLLKEWSEKRRAEKVVADGLTFQDWPSLPDPPDGGFLYDWRRAKLREWGKPILNWQRPPQKWPELSLSADKGGNRSDQQLT